MSDENQASGGMKALGWIFTLVVMAAAGAIGTSIGDEDSKGETTLDVLERPWSSAAVGALSLQLPEDLESFAVPMKAQEREAIAAMTSVFEAYQSTAGSVTVAVSHITYQPHVTVNLRGAAEGAVQRSNAEVGVSSAEATYAETTVSGLPAIRASVTFTEGQIGRSEAVSVSRGQELWQILTIFPDSPAALRAAERILGSLAVSR